MKFNPKAVTLLSRQGDNGPPLLLCHYPLFQICAFPLHMTHNLIPLLSLPGGSEWIIIALVVLLLFGGKKIPELMKGLGKGVRSFKDGLNDASRELKDAADSVEEDSKK